MRNLFPSPHITLRIAIIQRTKRRGKNKSYNNKEPLIAITPRINAPKRLFPPLLVSISGKGPPLLFSFCFFQGRSKKKKEAVKGSCFKNNNEKGKMRC